MTSHSSTAFSVISKNLIIDQSGPRHRPHLPLEHTLLFPPPLSLDLKSTISLSYLHFLRYSQNPSHLSPIRPPARPSMAIFTSPRSLQNAHSPLSPQIITQSQPGLGSVIFPSGAPHSNHPSFFHLVLLVFEAVLEVVCVSLPGYFAAKQGLFDADAQKLVANLNVTLFTPCLSMSKNITHCPSTLGFC